MATPQISGTGNNLMNIELRPSNLPANGEFQINGSNVITFDFGMPNVLLIPETVKISGKVEFAEPNNWGAGDVDNLRLDQYIGIGSLFRSLQFSTQQGSRQVLEKIQNYHQLLSILLPQTTDSQDFVSKNQMNFLGSQNQLFSTRQYLTNWINDGDNLYGIDFTMPVISGLTSASGNRIPLAKIGGLSLTFELNTNNSVFYGDVGGFTAEQLNKVKYLVKDLVLSAKCYNPTADEKKQLLEMKSGELEMNVFNSLFSVIQSSDSQTNFTINSKELVGGIMKMCPTNSVNNLSLNEFLGSRLVSNAGFTADMSRVSFLRQGVEFPVMHPIDIVPSGIESFLNYLTMTSLRYGVNDGRSAVSAIQTNPDWSIGTAGYGLNTANTIDVYNKLAFAIGIPYDFLESDAGADFQSKQLSINIQSALTDGNTNAVYLFLLQKAKIIFNEVGITVDT